MMTPEEVSQSTIENKTTGDSELEVEVGRFFGRKESHGYSIFNLAFLGQ